MNSDRIRTYQKKFDDIIFDHNMLYFVIFVALASVIIRLLPHILNDLTERLPWEIIYIIGLTMIAGLAILGLIFIVITNGKRTEQGSGVAEDGIE